MKAFLKDALYALLALAPRRGTAILMYHSVAENPEFFTVTPTAFAGQMRHLKEGGFRVLALAEVVEALERGVLLARKSVALTFDDGYRDNLSEALPVLEHFGFPATVFLTTSLIAERTTARRGTVLAMLRATDVRALVASRLVTIGSHGHRHVRLTALSPREQAAELTASKQILEDIAGAPVEFFAYPYGDFDPALAALTSRHFRAAFGVLKGKAVPESNRFGLPRNSVDSEVSMTQFQGIAGRGRV